MAASLPPSFPHFDKFLHFLALLGLSLPALMIFGPWSIVPLVALIIGWEVVQEVGHFGVFEYEDMAAGGLGLIAAIIVWLLLFI